MPGKKLPMRNLPELLAFTAGNRVSDASIWEQRRQEILAILGNEIYGIMPEPPATVYCALENQDESIYCYAHKARQYKLRLFFAAPQGMFSFPFVLTLPIAPHKVPVFVLINFRDNVPDAYYPTEEVMDSGCGVASFNYNDVTLDTEDHFQSGLAAKYPRDEAQKNNWGKIGMWAFAASRIMDYLQTRDDVDLARIGVIGHSRLGKTALWCGATDPRFALVISNNSGCGGAALARGASKGAEHIRNIVQLAKYWFCEKYQDYADNEQNMPFDQHFLVAAICPRQVYVASAEEDLWADPESEFFSCVAASPAWHLFGLAGLAGSAEAPAAPAFLNEGRVSYHIRKGSHFLSREDWRHYTAKLKSL